MSHTETILRAVNREPTEQVPFALLSSGAWAINRNDVTLQRALELPAETMADWLYEGYTLVDSGISWVGSGYNNIVVKAVGGKIKFRRKGTPDVVEPLFATADDTDAIDPASVLRDPDIQLLYGATRLLVEKERGERLVGASMWGPFTLTGLLFGADALMRSVYKNPEAVEKLMNFSVELYLNYMQGYIDAGARVIFMAEPSASGDMISRKHFEAVALPYIKRIYERLSAKGLVLGLHICGNTANRLDLIAQSGAQVMSLDYKVDLDEARGAFDGKIAFSGNMNPVTIVQNGTEDEIRASVLECIERAGGGGGYIVMPGCDIPPSTPPENLQTIAKVVAEYNTEHKQERIIHG
ncbi:MAG: uroporphyrinogen decarboxylase family protein [Oscillospiraceae bacterium]|nr:uroporphyrinogen decarboxylase family protein [Oscillospiraceae bacterium]